MSWCDEMPIWVVWLAKYLQAYLLPHSAAAAVCNNRMTMGSRIGSARVPPPGPTRVSSPLAVWHTHPTSQDDAFITPRLSSLYHFCLSVPKGSAKGEVQSEAWWRQGDGEDSDGRGCCREDQRGGGVDQRGGRRRLDDGGEGSPHGFHSWFVQANRHHHRWPTPESRSFPGPVSKLSLWFHSYTQPFHLPRTLGDLIFDVVKEVS